MYIYISLYKYKVKNCENIRYIFFNTLYVCTLFYVQNLTSYVNGYVYKFYMTSQCI